VTATTDRGFKNAAEDRTPSPLWELRLAAILSVISGMVDLIGFLSVGNIFPAHITGNLVIVSAAVLRDLRPAQVLVIPVFVLAVAATWLLARHSGKRGPALNRLLLIVQFLLLAAALAFSVMSPSDDPRSLAAVAAVILAVAAMACQHALLRLTLPKAPSTGVMTGNLTGAILALLDSLSRTGPLNPDVTGRLMRSLYPFLGFVSGCVLAACAILLVGEWAWSLPLACAALAVFVGARVYR
jgi:uncharacterized membrane protein YoaK (UPF0700 family)